ncbi:SH3 domain protein [Desulfocicer vacuolatum DSM 3385]|uniref:SH3 domain protein n=1 Tax=Desulfocicer vacuolatum DSM 3385 TaxID=1121400 RepID=A0A1W1ZU74_9BACT|nr:TIGR04211 family SH3 domain-containing protein [Desulfocicer vacuolatum]SMC51638.1 SH3 domain protein [Desulfocicer vacuolatum DSM 3385]
MTRFAKCSFIVLVFSFVLFVGISFAETVYVGGVMKITMRRGPGTKHKIIAMVATGDSLNIVENGRDWTRVRNSAGKVGWVLTRFITRDVPMKRQVEVLEKKNKDLTHLLEKIKQENRDFQTTREKLAVIEDAYNRLKKKSADFLALEAAHEEMAQAFTQQKDRILTLESRLNKEDIKWFLSGAGVLVVGILLGVSTRRKKHRSLL